MSEQLDLLMQLNIARELMRAPSKLKEKELKQYRLIAENLGDRCNFNSGWYAAQPDKALPGSASTEKISADLRTLTAAVLSQALPPKRLKAGRPPKDEPNLDGRYFFVVADFYSDENSKTLLECV